MPSTSRGFHTIVKATNVRDEDGVFAAFPPTLKFSSTDLAAMINDDRTANLNVGGGAAARKGGARRGSRRLRPGAGRARADCHCLSDEEGGRELLHL